MDLPPPTPPTDPELRLATEDQIQHQTLLQESGSGSRWLSMIGWDRFNAEKLMKAEKSLLGRVGMALLSRLIPVKLFNSTIYTISTKSDAAADDNKIPFVMIHGFGAGIAIWAANYDALAAHRPVHAIDLLGFGRSSRPQFNDDSCQAEAEYVQSLEDWRKAMKIDRMILAGHSFGGYLASSYALQHPSRVRHLVLIDPWGFPDPPLSNSEQKMPMFVRALGRIASYFNPLSSVRMAGPYGIDVIRRMHPELGMRYNIAEDPNAIYEYIYQINSRKPTGELAFKSISNNLAWAQRPMLHRFGNLDPSVPVTFIYGYRSWIDASSGFQIQAQRTNAYVDVKTIPAAGHHLYADNHIDFNLVMAEVSQIVNNERDISNPSKQTENHDV